MVAQNLPSMQETLVQFLGQEDPLEKAMATHSSILPRNSHTLRSLVGYSPWGWKQLDTTEQLSLTHLVPSLVFSSVLKDIVTHTSTKLIIKYNIFLCHLLLPFKIFSGGVSQSEFDRTLELQDEPQKSPLVKQIQETLNTICLSYKLNMHIVQTYRITDPPLIPQFF